MRKSLKLMVATLATAALATVPALAAPRVGDRVGSSVDDAREFSGVPVAVLVAGAALLALAVASGGGSGDDSESD